MAQMHWHDTNYSKRMMICVPTPSAAAGPYISVTVPAWFDAFWNVIQSTGFDVRFYYGADSGGGTTAYNRSSWTYASRVGVFNVEINDYSGATDVSEYFWIYWGYASATDGSTAATTTNLVSHTIAVAQPRAEDTVLALREPPGTATPTQRIEKTSYEERLIWWDITEMLGRSYSTGYGREASEFSLYSVEWDATAGTGVYVSGARDPAGAPDTLQAITHMVETEDGRTYVGIFVEGGTAGNDYTFSLRLFLSFPPATSTALYDYKAEARCLLQVRDPAE